MMQDELGARAREILVQNDRGGYTVPNEIGRAHV